MSYRDLCNDILDLDGARSAVVITMEGNILFQGIKKAYNHFGQYKVLKLPFFVQQ